MPLSSACGCFGSRIYASTMHLSGNAGRTAHHDGQSASAVKPCVWVGTRQSVTGQSAERERERGHHAKHLPSRVANDAGYMAAAQLDQKHRKAKLAPSLPQMPGGNGGMQNAKPQKHTRNETVTSAKKGFKSDLGATVSSTYARVLWASVPVSRMTVTVSFGQEQAYD